MEHLTDLHALKAWRTRQQGSIALVPTMGALHAGHMALVQAASAQYTRVIVSIFVNPKQFAPTEDLSRYPRTLEADMALLKAANVSAVFTPTPEALYPTGFNSTVNVYGLDTMLCGAIRAGHFSGVTTVVARLFLLIQPHAAYFGEKDYQQLSIIRRMNQDLPMVKRIIGIPTVRETDGLALSSRNQYLSAQQRQLAPHIYQTLQTIAARSTQEPLPSLLQWGKDHLLSKGVDKVDYLEARHSQTLALTDTPKESRLFVAAHLGTTRLIDNVAL